MGFLTQEEASMLWKSLGGKWFFGLSDPCVRNAIMDLPEVTLLFGKHPVCPVPVVHPPEDAMARTQHFLRTVQVQTCIASAFRASSFRTEPAGSSSHRAAAAVTGRAQADAADLPATQSVQTESLNAANLAAKLRALEGEPLFLRVSARKSGIHGWGLFAKRHMVKGGEYRLHRAQRRPRALCRSPRAPLAEFVIEYTGHMVSSGVADKLEQEYSERKLGGSCYLFRMDDDSIADATLSGSCARFINHSNSPNCDSRVVANAPDGRKRIVIQTLRDVFPGEEITYDYKFPFDFAKD
jgi:hypothetical protein